MQIIDSKAQRLFSSSRFRDTQIAAANQLRTFSTRKWLQVYTTHLNYSPQLNLGFFFRKNGTKGQTLSPLINYRQQKCSRDHRYTVKLSRINQMFRKHGSDKEDSEPLTVEASFQWWGYPKAH